MAIRAYLLIETQTGKSNAVLEKLNSLDQVSKADRVTGPYDVICVLETETLNEIGNIVKEQIHSMDGVLRTMSCMRLGD